MFDDDVLRQAFSLIDAHAGEAADFQGPVPEEAVARAEALLGHRLPPSYRRFLLRHGQGSVEAFEVMGLSPAQPDPELAPHNVVSLTLLARRHGLPFDMVVVHDIGDGDKVALDLSFGDEPGLLAWNPGMGGDRHLMYAYAESFPGFLLEGIRRALGGEAG